MAVQNYLQIENNVVTNCVVWNGDTNIWQPPADAIMLIQSTVPAIIWVYDDSSELPTFNLKEVLGAGNIGFTWDTTSQILTTNLPKPVIPPTI